MMLIMGCSSGFSTVPPTDTFATNAVRSKIGIREIKPGWVFLGREFSNETWMESSAATGQCKSVHRSGNSTIQWEEDYYPGVRTFVDPNGLTIHEYLTVHYDYLSGSFAISYFGKDPIIRGLMSGLRPTSSGDAGANNAVTLDVADKILAIWKMKRL